METPNEGLQVVCLRYRRYGHEESVYPMKSSGDGASLVQLSTPIPVNSNEGANPLMEESENQHENLRHHSLVHG